MNIKIIFILYKFLFHYIKKKLFHNFLKIIYL